jgi:hypothetical protein
MAAIQLSIKIVLTAIAAHLGLLATMVQSSAAEDDARKMVTFTSPFAKYSYSQLGFNVSNNAWGAGKLVEGVDYSTSVTFDPADFGRGTTFSWRYPGNTGGIFGYPHIAYSVDAAGVSTTQAGRMESLSASYSASLSDPANSTVAFDIWFNSQPNGPWATTSAELLIEVHPTSRGKPNQLFLLSGKGFKSATVYVSNTSAAGAKWKFIVVKLSADMLSGTLSISDIIKGLIRNGVLTGEEYLTSLQFGSEVKGGTGGLQINSLNYSWTVSPAAGDTTGNK